MLVKLLVESPLVPGITKEDNWELLVEEEEDKGDEDDDDDNDIDEEKLEELDKPPL